MLPSKVAPSSEMVTVPETCSPILEVPPVYVPAGPAAAAMLRE